MIQKLLTIKQGNFLIGYTTHFCKKNKINAFQQYKCKDSCQSTKYKERVTNFKLDFSVVIIPEILVYKWMYTWKQALCVHIPHS